MVDTNYISSIVKILETPKQQISNKNMFKVTCRAQLPQIKRTKIVHLTFWGNLARDVVNYYKPNDYIIVEGYLLLKEKAKFQTSSKISKKVEITVLKVYPFLLSYNRLLAKN